ncbi:hypothetical protein, partial [Paenibacillus xylanexedens]|uniref:hypothetical protein n=1 Tax=Paenibacillus xylanexedens TaxID=528191 RepID=UPI001C92CAAA
TGKDIGQGIWFAVRKVCAVRRYWNEWVGRVWVWVVRRMEWIEVKMEEILDWVILRISVVR